MSQALLDPFNNNTSSWEEREEEDEQRTLDTFYITTPSPTARREEMLFPVE